MILIESSPIKHALKHNAITIVRFLKNHTNLQGSNFLNKKKHIEYRGEIYLDDHLNISPASIKSISDYILILLS